MECKMETTILPTFQACRMQLEIFKLLRLGQSLRQNPDIKHTELFKPSPYLSWVGMTSLFFFNQTVPSALRPPRGVESQHPGVRDRGEGDDPAPLSNSAEDCGFAAGAEGILRRRP